MGIPDEPIEGPPSGHGVEPDVTCSPHEAVLARLDQGSRYGPVEALDGTTGEQAAAGYEEALRCG